MVALCDAAEAKKKKDKTVCDRKNEHVRREDKKAVIPLPLTRLGKENLTSYGRYLNTDGCVCFDTTSRWGHRSAHTWVGAFNCRVETVKVT